jgi:hypothetical protein
MSRLDPKNLWRGVLQAGRFMVAKLYTSLAVQPACYPAYSGALPAHFFEIYTMQLIEHRCCSITPFQNSLFGG